MIPDMHLTVRQNPGIIFFHKNLARLFVSHAHFLHKQKISVHTGHPLALSVLVFALCFCILFLHSVPAFYLCIPLLHSVSRNALSINITLPVNKKIVFAHEKYTAPSGRT